MRYDVAYCWEEGAIAMSNPRQLDKGTHVLQVKTLLLLGIRLLRLQEQAEDGVIAWWQFCENDSDLGTPLRFSFGFAEVICPQP